MHTNKLVITVTFPYILIISYFYYFFIVSKNGVSNTINERDRDLKIESEITENHKDGVVINNTTSLCDMTNLVSLTFNVM